MKANKTTFDFHEIKTFEDACQRLGISCFGLACHAKGDMEAFSQAKALYKLLVIQKAINNGVWRDKYGRSYYPYWALYSEREIKCMNEEQRDGFRSLNSCAIAVSTENPSVSCALAGLRSVNTFTTYGLPFCFNSEEAALYAAKQFESIFFDFYGIKVEKYNLNDVFSVDWKNLITKQKMKISKWRITAFVGWIVSTLIVVSATMRGISKADTATNLISATALLAWVLLSLATNCFTFKNNKNEKN